jgi:hypothetical protein
MADSGNIKVVVRCRPLNSRGECPNHGMDGCENSSLTAATEKNRGASHLIEVNGLHQLTLNPPSEGDSRENARATKKKAMPFSFDRAYDENTEQQELFEYVGLELLEHSFNGFNTVRERVAGVVLVWTLSDPCSITVRLCIWTDGVGQVSQHGGLCGSKRVDTFDVLSAL